jgi:hypothetical protein
MRNFPVMRGAKRQREKPTQNAYIERFNRTARQEWLELNIFEDIEHAQWLATQCKGDSLLYH